MSKFLDYDGLEHYTQKIKTGMDSIIQNGTKNLLNSTISYVGGDPGGKTHYVINNDGSITISTDEGNSQCYIYFNYSNMEAMNNVDIILTGCPEGGGNPASMTNAFFIAIQSNSNNHYIDSGNGWQGKITDGIKNIFIGIRASTPMTNVTFYPMVCTQEIYKISKSYQPYAMTNYELTNNVASTSEIDNVWGNA